MAFSFMAKMLHVFPISHLIYIFVFFSEKMSTLLKCSVFFSKNVALENKKMTHFSHSKNTEGENRTIKELTFVLFINVYLYVEKLFASSFLTNKKKTAIHEKKCYNCLILCSILTIKNATKCGVNIIKMYIINV